jgi:hypothetical protein
MKKFALVAFLAVLGWSGLASGSVTLLSDGNSSLLIDSGTQAGVNTWTIDNVDALFQRWFWYRVGTTGPELSLETLGTPTLDPDTAALKVIYANSQLKVTLNYSLTGGGLGTGQSDLNVGITVKNLTGSAMALSFFDYANATLSAGADTAVVQYPGHIVQTAGSSQMDLVSTLTPSHSEVGLTTSTRDSLNNGSATQLADNLSAGPGDATAAFEWDLNLAAGGSKTWGEAMSMQVPEPATLTLLAMGGLVLLRGRRRA